MPASINWTANVDGLAELDKALLAITKELQRKAIRSALRRGAKEWYVYMKARLHRTPGAAIHTSSGTPREHLIDALKIRMPNKPKFGKWTASVGFRGDVAYIANFIERGTAPHVIEAKPGSTLYVPGRGFVTRVLHPGQPARPFMRPAADTRSGRVIVEFKNELADRIKGVVRRRGRKVYGDELAAGISDTTILGLLDRGRDYSAE